MSPTFNIKSSAQSVAKVIVEEKDLKSRHERMAQKRKRRMSSIVEGKKRLNQAIIQGREPKKR